MYANLLKRAVDVVCALILLVVLSPLFVLVWFLARTDAGPAFFFQQRLGRGAAEFRIVKFRTMRVDADDWLDENGRPTAQRVTTVGKWLRKTSLDELPQLWNILVGDMSFIGPRPVLSSWNHKFVGEDRVRFELRPGITGLAQVNGRNTLRWSERARLDRQYVRTIGLCTDARIALATVVTLCRPQDVVLDRNAVDVDDL